MLAELKKVYLCDMCGEDYQRFIVGVTARLDVLRALGGIRCGRFDHGYMAEGENGWWWHVERPDPLVLFDLDILVRLNSRN